MRRLPHPRFLLFLVVLVGAAAAAVPLLPLADAIVIAFDLAAFMFLISVGPLWWSGTPSRMRDDAARDDGGRILLLLVSGVVAVVILVALGRVVGSRTMLGPPDLALVILTLVLAWSFVNTIFAFHYAHLYYERSVLERDHVVLEFPETCAPEFSDFCYFFFVIGMTFQVSDVAIASPRLRRIVTLHAVLAFFFNLGVLALTINVLAGVL